MKLYTKTGDKGKTSLFTGERVAKSSSCIEALGAIDECNSTLGAALAFLPKEIPYEKIREQLIVIQHALFDLGAAIATPRTKAGSSKINKTRFDSEETELLEEWIDEMEGELPSLKTFILPGGHQSGSFLHLARSLCRRAERTIVPLFEKGDAPENVLVYINRLSDYLFMMARYVNHLTGVSEKLWEPHKLVNSG